MIDIHGYEGLYKFDIELNQVFSIKYNRYLKNILDRGSYYVRLFKNGKGKKYNISYLSNIYNPIENNNFVDIPNYTNYKFDIQLEQVFNIKFNKYLKNYLTKDGYYKLSLSKNGKVKRYGLHQLVYICNNPTEDISDYQIDHIDGNRTNNKIENLRKATRSDNCSNAKTYITNKSTGIKYIHKNKNNTYRFRLTKNGITYQKYFKILEEAIKHRDRVVR